MKPFLHFQGRHSLSTGKLCTTISSVTINIDNISIVSPILSDTCSECSKLFKEAQTRIVLSDGTYIDIVESYADVCSRLY